MATEALVSCATRLSAAMVLTIPEPMNSSVGLQSCFNIKTVFLCIGLPIIKIHQSCHFYSGNSYNAVSFIMGIPMLEDSIFILR